MIETYVSCMEVERACKQLLCYLYFVIALQINIKSIYRVEWGKAPMWGKGPTTEITFMDGNRGNICTRVFSYVIGPPGRAVADGENTS